MPDAETQQDSLLDKQDGIELAWGLIANAWDFVERVEGPTADLWMDAATRWRDTYMDSVYNASVGSDPLDFPVEESVTAEALEQLEAAIKQFNEAVKAVFFLPKVDVGAAITYCDQFGVEMGLPTLLVSVHKELL